MYGWCFNIDLVGKAHLNMHKDDYHRNSLYNQIKYNQKKKTIKSTLANESK